MYKFAVTEYIYHAHAIKTVRSNGFVKTFVCPVESRVAINYFSPSYVVPHTSPNQSRAHTRANNPENNSRDGGRTTSAWSSSYVD